MPKSSHDIKTGKRSEFIISIIYHVRTTANVAAMCAFVTTYYYDRAVGLYISVAVVMRTLLDRKNFSSSANGQVAAHRVGLLSKGFGNTYNHDKIISWHQSARHGSFVGIYPNAR